MGPGEDGLLFLQTVRGKRKGSSELLRGIYKTMKKGYFWGIKKCLSCSLPVSLLLAALYMGNGVLSPLMVQTVGNMINHIDRYLLSYGGLLAAAAILALAYAYRYICAVLTPFLVNHLKLDLKTIFGRELLAMRGRISLEDLELGKNQDVIENTIKKMEEHLSEIYVSTCTIMSFGIEIAGLLGIVSRFQIWVIPALLLFALPLTVASFKGGRAVFQEDKGIVILTRWMEYYSRILSDKDHVNERVLFGYSDQINKKYEAAHRKRSDANTLVLAKWTLRIRVCAVILLTYAVGVTGTMIYSVLQGKLSLGLFMTLAGTMISLAKRITQTLSRLIFDIAGQREYLEELDRFFAMEGKTEYSDYHYEKEEFSSLQIVDLTYRYPNGSRDVLSHLNLTVEKGKSYSLVGINGAGKSTLIKILLGMYKEYEGTIWLNGRNLKEYSDNRLRNIFSLVNQDYARYQISLKDNLILGQEELWNPRVLAQTGLDEVVNALPHREYTHLGRLEKGVELSGGEWQKLAIGRALMRKTSVTILDEPTASLSPRMEDEFYTNVLKVKKGGTLLLISHRMAAAKLTDKIILLNGGQIQEEGSHQELMKKKGLYYQMFEAQRRNYDEKAE